MSNSVSVFEVATGKSGAGPTVNDTWSRPSMRRSSTVSPPQGETVKGSEVSWYGVTRPVGSAAWHGAAEGSLAVAPPTAARWQPVITKR